MGTVDKAGLWCQAKAILPDGILGKTLSFSEPNFLKLHRAASIWEGMSLTYLVLHRHLINITMKLVLCDYIP